MTGYAFAYNNRNQATSQADACGNGQEPANIGCQNTDSQIQGDENGVTQTSQQTFPPVPPCPGPGDANSEEPTANSEPGSLQESSFEISSPNLEGDCTTFDCLPGGRVNFDFLKMFHDDDGTVSGNYVGFITHITHNPTERFDGRFTDGTTDGSTFFSNWFW